MYEIILIAISAVVSSLVTIWFRNRKKMYFGDLLLLFDGDEVYPMLELSGVSDIRALIGYQEITLRVRKKDSSYSEQ